MEQDQDAGAGPDKLESQGPGAGAAVTDADVQMQEPDNAVRQVHPRRFRLWGLAASPGDGCTATVVSKYNTQHPNRRDRAEVMFGWHVPGDGEEAAAAPDGKRAMPVKATTEARVWEWMYGRGPEVPGTTAAADNILVLNSLSTLRRQFRDVLPQIHCVFCNGSLQEKGATAVCSNGHSFGTFCIIPSSLPQTEASLAEEQVKNKS